MKVALIVFGIAILWWNRDDYLDPPPSTMRGWVLDTAVKAVSIVFWYVVFSLMLMWFK